MEFHLLRIYSVVEIACLFWFLNNNDALLVVRNGRLNLHRLTAAVSVCVPVKRNHYKRAAIFRIYKRIFRGIVKTCVRFFFLVTTYLRNNKKKTLMHFAPESSDGYKYDAYTQIFFQLADSFAIIFLHSPNDHWLFVLILPHIF